MKSGVLYLVSCLCLLAFLVSCEQQQRFKIKGVIGQAEGKMLYFERMGIENISALDSVRLDTKGGFEFSQERPLSPEFYRLRIEDKIINLAIDSTEEVTIKADYADFPVKYAVSGSENNNKIRELTLLQINLQKNINELIRVADKKEIDGKLFEDSLSNLLKAYKDTVKMNYIFAAPNKTYAYYALFQRVNDYLIFDPLNSKDDIKCFGAVATSLNNMYPHADRSKNLYNIAIKGMKNTRTGHQKTVELPEGKMSESGIIDINLKDIKGNSHKLSELNGKVVLLDFIIYQTPMASPHNIALNELYNKYASEGLEIYQVSLDADEHFWKTTAEKTPWINVRDPEGIYSSIARTYDIHKLPALFLINRSNELVKRQEEIKKLEEEIKKLL